MTAHRRRAADRLYAPAVIAGGALVLALRAATETISQPPLLAALLGVAVVASTVKVRLPMARGQATLSMSYFTDVIGLLLVGPLGAMLVASAGAAAQCAFLSRSRPTWLRTLFSVAVLVVTIECTARTATALGGFAPQATLLHLATATLATATVFFVVNSGLVAIAVALSRREPVVRTWYAEFLWTAPMCLISVVSAVVVVQAHSAYLWAALLAAGPLYITLKAFRIYGHRLDEQEAHVREVSHLHLASVEALARAIDARAQSIGASGDDSHVRRVQVWAVALGEAAGMAPADIEAVKVAALLHDIGKLAVPESILSKPGPLTAKEFARMRVHPIIGADIISAVPFPYPVASFIRSHHERWDGRGYPDGLSGEAIPQGARVLAVADYFDTLDTAPDRPAGAGEVRAALGAAAGTALDPALVHLFLSILPAPDAVAGRPSADPEARLPVSRRIASAPAARSGRRAAAPSVFDNIARATGEMRALHDIAQTLGTRLSVDDTMALLTSKLNRLVPGSCWMLFLYDDAEDMLRARFATGPAAAALAAMTLPGGTGVSGWTARHRTALSNARAAADFEAAGLAMIEPPMRSALSCPLVDGSSLVGVLTVYHDEAAPFTDEHQHILDQVAGQVASVLRNAVAFEQLRDVSLTDALTALPNMRGLAACLQARPLDPPGRPAPTALVMIDVDHFKAVNDAHGHQAGDAALRAVAACIRAHVREADVCARYAGDEFLLVLRDCDQAEAERRGGELQAAVAAAAVPGPDGAALPLALSISVGVGVFPHDGTTVPALVAAADRRMYGNKAVRHAAASAAGRGGERIPA